MHHYTYKIHYSTGKYYIGVRTSKCKPEDDTKYLGSSKYTPNDLVIKKEILAEFPTRAEAIAHEVELHKFYDIAKNPNFYNQAKQTSKKFDVTGTKHTKEHSEKIANSLRGKKYDKARVEKAIKNRQKIFDERKQRLGYVHKRSPEYCEKIRQMKLGITKSDKGIKRSMDYKNKHYASRRKHSESILWVHTSGKEVKATIYEMGHLYASDKKRPVAGFTLVYIRKNKSYLGWSRRE